MILAVAPADDDRGQDDVEQAPVEPVAEERDDDVATPDDADDADDAPAAEDPAADPAPEDPAADDPSSAAVTAQDDEDEPDHAETEAGETEAGETEAGETEAGETEAAGSVDAATTSVTPASTSSDGPSDVSSDTPADTPSGSSPDAAAIDAPTVWASPTDAATTRVAPVPPAPSPALDPPTVQVPPAAAEAPATGADEEPAPSSGRRGVLVAALVAAVVVLLGLGGWLLSGGGPSGVIAPQAAPVPRVTLTPAADASQITPASPAEVHVSDGRVADVALQGPEGPVAGTATPDGWRATGPLAYGTTYTWSGSAIDADGRATPLTGRFTTLEPQRTVSANLNIADDATVGVAAPIVVQFDGDVGDKAAAERALTVRTSVPTEGSWAWLPDTEEGSRAHWRPKEYWKPGTQVDVAANLVGVDTGGGTWGAADVTTHFTIGRSQIVKADVNSFQMVVVRDGKPVMTVPASYGLGSDPNRNTTNGTHVVMSKEASKLMTNPAYGYFNVPEKWAVRISNNGEFIHANPQSTSAQGNDNVTHGCVNLSTEDAQAYFDTAMFGDPVEVTGSPVPMPRTDIYDWSLDWDEWSSMSALRS